MTTHSKELDFTVKGCICTVFEPEYWIDENCPIHGEMAS